MNRFYLLFFILTSLVSCKPETTPIPLEIGISYELAAYRKQQVSDITYNLHFKIPKAKETAITANLVALFNIHDLKNDVLLDFNEVSTNIKSIKTNGENTKIHHEKEHIIIDKSELNLGENIIEIDFNAGETSLNRNEEFLYTLLVPDRASTLFPCFDQPDLKAKYNLKITAPNDWKVLAGSFKENEVTTKDFTTHTFSTSDLMSTYLFSFVAGEFTETIKNPGAFEMRFLYRENNSEKIAQSVGEIFKIHQKSIDFLEEYTSVKFPFQKMDFAAIPPFQYGGMEHVGAIQYRQSSLFLDKNATQSQKLRRAKLIAHETSHMWFGDLVTMKWFNDVWMKEVFANFMADKIVNPLYPEINHNLSFLMSHYPSAYSEDRTKGTNPIRQNLNNLKNAGSLYGRIIYNKAPIMMRQLEHLLGEKAFQKGIEEYIKTYQNSNADWNDLVAILDKKSTEDIRKWSDVWVNSSGRPIFYEEKALNEKGEYSKLVIHQKAEDNTNTIWKQSFTITAIDKNGLQKEIVITNMETSFDATPEILDFKPVQILYNSNSFGYGVFPIDIKKIATYKSIKSGVSRGYQFINLYENMLIGTITPVETFSIFLNAIENEKNELISNYLSNGIQTIYWSFLTKQQQQELQEELENTLFSLLELKLPVNLKKTLFNLYQSIAVSDHGKENLYKIWSKEKTISNLFLNENDFTSLAMQLAIVNHSKATELLKAQEKQISNQDRLKRFKWLLPSLSNHTETRDVFMQSLFDKENRANESWVQNALRNIHHPLRQDDGVKYIKPILEELEEVQLTGDIFFPKGWLANSIGNYSSEKAYLILQEFLAENPNLKPSLLQKLHQTTDNLVRAQKIKK